MADYGASYRYPASEPRYANPDPRYATAERYAAPSDRYIEPRRSELRSDMRGDPRGESRGDPRDLRELTHKRSRREYDDLPPARVAYEPRERDCTYPARDRGHEDVLRAVYRDADIIPSSQLYNPPTLVSVPNGTPMVIEDGPGGRTLVPVDVRGVPAGLPVNNGRLSDPLPLDASSTLFVDGLPVDCSRRETAHIFRPFIGYREVRLVQKDAKRPGADKLLLCFVEFVDSRCAATALDALQGYRFDELERDSPSLRLTFARNPGPRGAPIREEMRSSRGVRSDPRDEPRRDRRSSRP